MPANGGIPNCGRMAGGGPAARPARLGRGKGRPGWWRVPGNRGVARDPGASGGNVCRGPNPRGLGDIRVFDLTES